MNQGNHRQSLFRQQHADTNLAGKAELRRTWTILTRARTSTGPGVLSVLVFGGCPSVPRWFHPQVKSCARTARNPNPSKATRSEQNRAEARQEMNKHEQGNGTHAAVVADGEGVAAAGDDGGDGVGRQRLHAVGPVLLLVPAHAQLPVLPGTPAQNENESRNQWPPRRRREKTEFSSAAPRAREENAGE